jgi:hypothetical protein
VEPVIASDSTRSCEPRIPSAEARQPVRRAVIASLRHGELGLVFYPLGLVAAFGTDTSRARVEDEPTVTIDPVHDGPVRKRKEGILFDLGFAEIRIVVRGADTGGALPCPNKPSAPGP